MFFLNKTSVFRFYCSVVALQKVRFGLQFWRLPRKCSSLVVWRLLTRCHIHIPYFATVNFYFCARVADCVSQYLSLMNTGSNLLCLPTCRAKGKVCASVQMCQTSICTHTCYVEQFLCMFS